jgi:cytochrome c biogenesis protein CcmG/thiol:disulfide interchange protein DsbE
VVNVWASWCIPCRSEAPLFRKASARYAGRLRFLGLDSEDSRGEALAFIREFGLPYPSGFDPSGAIRHHLHVLGLPTTFFYRAGGETAFVHNGEIHSGDLQSKIDFLLESSKSTSSPRDD